MGEENIAAAYEAPPPVRRLGRTLHRHRRLRIGLIQLAYVVGGIVLGLVLPRIPWGSRYRAPRRPRCCSQWERVS